MATADEYAAWIVKNADKRGTPAFDTVAAAYKAARESITPGEGMPSARAEQPENLMGENAARDLTAEQQALQRAGYRARLAGVGGQGPGVVGEGQGFSAPGPEGGLGQQLKGIAQGMPLSLYSGVAGLTGDILPSGTEAANAIYGPAANPAVASGRESGMIIGIPGGAEGAVVGRALSPVGKAIGTVMQPVNNLVSRGVTEAGNMLSRYRNAENTAILGGVAKQGPEIISELRANENVPGSMLTSGPAAAGVGSQAFSQFTNELAAKAPETYAAIEAQNAAARQAQLGRAADVTAQGTSSTAAKLANVDQSTTGQSLIDMAKSAKKTMKENVIAPAYKDAFKAAGNSKIDITNVINKAEEILGQPLADIKIPDMPDVAAKLAKLRPPVEKAPPIQGMMMERPPARAMGTLEDVDAIRKAINKDVASANAAYTNPASATKLRELGQLHSTIDDAIETATKAGTLSPEAKNLYDKAVGLYRGPYVERFKMGLNADITANTIKNEAKINPSNVVSQYLKDPRATDQFLNLYGRNAKALDTAKAGIESLYRDNVIKNGAIDPAAHAKFMTDYGQQLATLDQNTRMGIAAKLNAIGERAGQLAERRGFETELGKKIGAEPLPAGPQAAAIQQKVSDATKGLSSVDLTSLAKLSQDLAKEARQTQLAKTPSTLKSQLPGPMRAEISGVPSKISVVVNYALRKLANKVSDRQAQALGELFADPKTAADAIQKALEWEAQSRKVNAARPGAIAAKIGERNALAASALRGTSPRLNALANQQEAP